MITEKMVFFLSWLTARGSGIASICFKTDTLSPALKHRTCVVQTIQQYTIYISSTHVYNGA